MRAEDIDAEIAAQLDEYRRERAAIEDEMKGLTLALHDLEVGHKAVVDALEGLKARANGTAQDGTATPDAAGMVKDIVMGRLGDRFTRMDIQREVQEEHGEEHALSRSATIGELETLVKRGWLRITVKGRGRRATVYERIRNVDRDTSIVFQQHHESP